MYNRWIKAPKHPEDLPFQVKAEKRMLWFIVIPAHDEWPEARFVMAGSLVFNGAQYVINDKECGMAGGYYYLSVLAYQECPQDPEVFPNDTAKVLQLL